MSHQQFVERFDEYLEAWYPPAGGNRSDTGRRKLAASIAEQLRQRGARRVLDCAAGTGCASLDLLQQVPGEFEIHCCDGDRAMVRMLARRAAERKIDLGPLVPTPSWADSENDPSDAMVINWAELDELADDYDYVFCRGNALVYADTWTGDDHVASDATVHHYLERMAGRVRAGGHLHVDAPRTIQLEPTIRRVLGTETAAWSIEEKVTIEEDSRRRWTLRFRDGDDEPVEFARYSSLLTIDDIETILDDIGFVETKPRSLEHERSNYGVIIARKPS